MKKLLLLGVFATGCVHTGTHTAPKAVEKPKSSIEDRVTDLEKKTKQMDYSIDYVAYEQINIYCFNFLDICDLKATDKCLATVPASKATSCIKQSHEACFKLHETCIIDNWHAWKSINKAKGRDDQDAQKIPESKQTDSSKKLSPNK